MEQALENLKYIGLGLYFLFLLRFLLLAFKAYDDIYLYEYDHLPEQWEKDGKPRGFEFWRFPKPSWKDLYRPAAFRRATISPLLWLFINPKWTEGHPEVLKHFSDLRKNVLCWNIGMLLLFGLIALLANL